MRRITFTMMFLIAYSNILLSQLPADQTFSIKVKARVESNVPLEIITLQHLTVCGQMTAGNNSIYISPVKSSFAGLIRARGRPGTHVRLKYDVNEELPAQKGHGTIFIEYELSGNHEHIQEASHLIDTGEVEFNLNADGIYYLWLGGWVNTINATPGVYKGKFTVEIQYI